MKTKHIVFAAFAVVVLASILALRIWPRTLPPEQCSEVYRHYAGRPDLKVGFVKDYRVDDSITVDVTTITAKDSAGWEALMVEMKIHEIHIEGMREALSKGCGSVLTYYCKKGYPDTRTKLDIPNCELVVVSPFNREFYIFNIMSKEEANRIADVKRKEFVHQHK